MIREIEIRNFRSIKELTFQPKSLCVLIGPNSCGKSNILRAIDLTLGEGWATKGRVSRDLFNDVNKPIKIRVELSKGIDWHYYGKWKCIKTVSLEMRMKPDLECKVRLWEDYPHDRQGDGYYANEEFKKACHFLYIPSSRDLIDQLRVSNWTILGKVMRAVYEHYIDHVGDEMRLKEEFRGLMQQPKEFLEKDFDPEKITFHKFVETLKRYCNANSIGMARKFDVELDIYNLNWFYKTIQIGVTEQGNDKIFDAEEVGSGMQNLVLLSLFQSYAKLMGGRAILAMEEPEIYLYPHAQRELYKSFQMLSEHSQIFYTTHNPNFIDPIRADEIELVRKLDDEGTVLLEKDRDYLRRANLEGQRFRIYTHFNTERNEIFFSKKVILVEGPSDRILWTTLLEQKAELNLQKNGVSVIECGGKKGVIYFLGVLRLIGFAEYFAVWDSDDDIDDPTDDPSGLLKMARDEGKGLEIPETIEKFLRKQFPLGKYPQYRFTPEKKVENAYKWAADVRRELIPEEFQSVFNFATSEEARLGEADEPDDDLPF